MIRPATEADLAVIVAMSARFYATTSYPGIAPFDPVAVEAIARLLLTQGVLLVAVADGQVVGMVGLVVAAFPFNPAVRTANEVVWWVEPGARQTGAGVALLRAVAPACRQAGAVAVQMMTMADSPAQASELYARLGYTHTESSYTKGL